MLTNGDRPAYKQIADHLRSSIASGEFVEGDVLPSEKELMESYSVARGTVREAVAVLKAEGLVETARGRGAVVVASIDEDIDVLRRKAAAYDELEPLIRQMSAIAGSWSIPSAGRVGGRREDLRDR